MRNKGPKKNGSNSLVPSKSDNKDEEDRQKLIEQLKNTLDESSTKNRNLSIVFYTISLYIFLSTVSTTDVMLLLPENSFELPLVNIELDLLSFFYVAPLLLLALHYNLLFNYNMHLQKLHKYQEKSDECEPEFINPSHYDFAFFLGTDTFKGFWSNVFLGLLVYLLPLFILIVIYIRFADYHDFVITLLHLVIVIADIWMVFLFIRSKIEYVGANECSHKLNDQKQVNWILDFLRDSRAIVLGAILLIMSAFVFVHYIFFFFPMVSSYDPAYADENRTSRLDPGYNQVFNLVAQTVCQYTYSELPKMDSDCIPRLTVREKDMVRISENSMYLPRVFNLADLNMTLLEAEEQLVLKYGSRIDLSDRNLRYADLNGVVLTRANLEESDFQGARLVSSQLQGAILEHAKFNGANLSFAQLEGARLSKSHFQDARFIMADLQKAVMAETDLSWARFDRARLQGAYFYQSYLKGANFNRAQLQGARLSESHLLGSSLWETDLTGARLWRLDINGSTLLGADMLGVSFYQVQMNGVDLSYADLTAALFEDVEISVVNLYKTRFYRNGFENLMKISGISRYKDYDREEKKTALEKIKRNPPDILKTIVLIKLHMKCCDCKWDDQNQGQDLNKTEIEKKVKVLKDVNENYLTTDHYMKIVGLHINKSIIRLKDNKSNDTDLTILDLEQNQSKKIEDMLCDLYKETDTHQYLVDMDG